MRNAVIVAIVLAVVTLCNVEMSSAEIDTSFTGFPTINVLQPGNPTFDSPPGPVVATGPEEEPTKPANIN